jgi:streptogramin lyase
MQGAAISGEVHGGQQPIVGASVYLYAANTTGYGNASVSLLTSATGNPADGNGNYYVITDANGNFSITGDYTCPSTASQVYLYAIGGNPGSGTNSAAGLLAALGACTASGTLSSTLFAWVNEVSTIATAYSIAGYATDATHVSSSSSALAATGIANAFDTVQNLETLSTGVANFEPYYDTEETGQSGNVPQSGIDTLANILAACINSTGPGSTGCTTLLGSALSGGTTGTAPTDTATAAINMAHNPGSNIAALYALSTASPPFAPALSAAPNDFTISINFLGDLNEAQGIAIGPSGAVWVANNGGTSISHFTHVGKAGTYTGGGLDDPYDIAIDASGNAWATSQGNDTINELNSSGTAESGSGYTGAGLDYPCGIAIDTLGDAWVASPNDNNISEFSSEGSVTSSITTGGSDYPGAVAFDVSGNVWVANEGSSISEFNSSGTAITGSSGYTGGGLDDPQAIAVDASGNVWIANGGSNSISEFSSSGMALSPSTGYTGGGLHDPESIAIDGAGNVWTASVNFTLNEFNSSGVALSGSNGYKGIQAYAGSNGIAIDGSGNVWVTSSEDVIEFVGAASPVVTPIVANLLAPYGTYAVNKP